MFVNTFFLVSRNFTWPFVPESYNIADFEGEVLHSKDYRIPNTFNQKTVLVVGRGPSAIDISLELAEVATQVRMETVSLNVILEVLRRTGAKLST